MSERWNLIPERCGATINDKNDRCDNVADAYFVVSGAKDPDGRLLAPSWVPFCSIHPRKAPGSEAEPKEQRL